MTRGIGLWLRHHHIPLITAIAVVSAFAVTAMVTLGVDTDGGTVEVATLWIAAVTALPLMFLFTFETEIDKVAPRSLTGRRVGLLLIVLLVALVVSLGSYPTHVGDFGSLAVFRDILGLVGLGLISLAVLPPVAMWVAPMAAALASQMFSWPLYPSATDSTWGALRAPGVLHMYGGAPDLSVPVCLALAMTGVVVLLADIRIDVAGHHPQHWPAPRSAETVRPQNSTVQRRTSLLTRGFTRATLAVPLAALIAVLTGWTLLSNISAWGGSPRLLLSKDLPSVVFIPVGVSMMTGVVCGQTRWRSALVIWERLSTRQPMAVASRTLTIAALIAVTGTGIPVLVLTAAAALDPLGHGIPARVMVHEVMAGSGRTLAAMMMVIAGALVGAAIGNLSRRIWLAPLCLVLSMIALLPLPRLADNGIDNELSAEYGYTACMAVPHEQVTVCTTEPNRAYLPAAAHTIRTVYQQADPSTPLPRTIRLTNKMTQGLVPEQARATTRPTVGLNLSRRLSTPAALDEHWVRESLAYSIAGWCAGTQFTDVQDLITGNPTQGSPTISRTLTSLAHCRG
ncbi:hypothetical protein [Acidipropionibacterium thoenii]|uniref:hypothetical protein n=1 Tax=Acidipropionibacterium thoenii TaxID=1751 RepID=UPI0003FB161F|nr:hypothetical protein [Acidipropionibacterium thoenii]